MLEKIWIVEKDYSTKVKAIITDAASDCRKACRLVVEQHLHLLSLHCFAHQVHVMAAISMHASQAVIVTLPLNTFFDSLKLICSELGCQSCLLGNVIQCVLSKHATNFSLVTCFVVAAADEFAGWQLLGCCS